MGYYINLKKITLNHFKKNLKSADLIPSWMILKQDIDKNLDIIKSYNVKNLNDLLTRLKNKDKIEDFFKQTGLSKNYLAVLKRVVKGYRQKPNRIKDFPNISKKVVEKLEKLKLQNTLKLYDEIRTSEKRENLSQKTGINRKDILKLAKLTDLSRIRWVNHTFAFMLLDSGFDTVQKVANAEPKKMYEKIKFINQEKNFYKHNIGVRDMKRCIDSAKELEFEVEY